MKLRKEPEKSPHLKETKWLTKQETNQKPQMPPLPSLSFAVTENMTPLCPINRGNAHTAANVSGVRRMAYDRAGTVLHTQDVLGQTVTSAPGAGRNYAAPAAISTGNLRQLKEPKPG